MGGVLRIFKNHTIRYLCLSRSLQQCNNEFLKLLIRYLLYREKEKYGIEIDFTSSKIGEGLQLVHAYNITVNKNAVIGRNAVMFKGSTIGSVRSGKRKGAPTIGDNVVIGCNAFVCGGIHVGNNVLISANAFVDFDIPDNSLVFGNPGVIKYKDNASMDYMR